MMYNPNHFFHFQGKSTKIINGKIVDDNKWNIFSDNGKKFKGDFKFLDKNKNKKYKFRDFNLKDLSNIIENKIVNSKTKKNKILSSKNKKNVKKQSMKKNNKRKQSMKNKKN